MSKDKDILIKYMSFGKALKQLKKGKKVARKKHSGHLILRNGDLFSERMTFNIEVFLHDIFADDWYIVD